MRPLPLIHNHRVPSTARTCGTERRRAVHKVIALTYRESRSPRLSLRSRSVIIEARRPAGCIGKPHIPETPHDHRSYLRRLLGLWNSKLSKTSTVPRSKSSGAPADARRRKRHRQKAHQSGQVHDQRRRQQVGTHLLVPAPGELARKPPVDHTDRGFWRSTQSPNGSILTSGTDNSLLPPRRIHMVYQARLEPRDGGHLVTLAYGRRGSPLTTSALGISGASNSGETSRDGSGPRKRICAASGNRPSD